MRTPCMEAPEAWVGKDDQLRAAAANDCRTKCPVFEECKAGKFGTPGPDDHGVWAGTDYTRTGGDVVGRPCAVCGKVNRSATGYHPRTCKGCIETKDCQHCGATFERTYHSNAVWAKAKFCDTICAGKGKKVAA